MLDTPSRFRHQRPALHSEDTEYPPIAIDEEARMIFDTCKRRFDHIPSEALLAQARSREEASFYMAVADFFLQQRQAELIARGVY